MMNLINNITWLAALCFLGGFAFILFELHIPTVGIAGIIGALLLIMGIVLTAKTFMEALVLIIIILALVGLALMWVLNSAAKGKLSKTLVLPYTQAKSTGYISNEDLQFFLNKEGTAITVLRPAGTADFDGVRLDVVTEGGYIEKGTGVRVVEVQGRRIVVKAIENAN